MPEFSKSAVFVWCGKPNPFKEGIYPWQRTELAREMSGSTVAAFYRAAGKRKAFAKVNPDATLKRLLKLQLIDFSEKEKQRIKDQFSIIQSERAKKQWENPEFRISKCEQVGRQSKKWWQNNPEYRVIYSKRMIKQVNKQWQDIEFREAHSKRTAKWSRKKWQEPEYRAAQSAGMSKRSPKIWRDPKYRIRMHDALTTRWADELFCQKMARARQKTAKRLSLGAYIIRNHLPDLPRDDASLRYDIGKAQLNGTLDRLKVDVLLNNA
jgi:hypothetical protein